MYDDTFYANREKYRVIYGYFAQWLFEHFRFESVIDVGCGACYLTSWFHDKGIPTLGIEGSRSAFARIPEGMSVLKADLFQVLKGNKTLVSFDAADLVSCIEVAEHLPSIYADDLVRFCCAHCYAHGLVFFTAAPPAALVPNTGIGHVNEQPKDYWISRFESRGFRLLAGATSKFQADCRARGCVWVVDNAMMFVRDKAAE